MKLSSYIMICNYAAILMDSYGSTVLAAQMSGEVTLPCYYCNTTAIYRKLAA